MTLEPAAQLLWGAGVLVLAVSALMTMRPSRKLLLRSLVAWAAIGLLLYLVLA